MSFSTKAARGARALDHRGREHVWALLFAVSSFSAVLAGACGDGRGGTNGGGGGADVIPTAGECGSDKAVGVEAGEGVGSAFERFEDGALLPLEFASQAGLEAAVSVRTEGMLPEEVVTVQLSLLVDGSPIGESTTSGESLRCEDEWSRVDTALPIDVTEHPTVVSVAQLVEAPADLVVEVYGEEGLLIERTVKVVLNP